MKRTIIGLTSALASLIVLSFVISGGWTAWLFAREWRQGADTIQIGITEGNLIETSPAVAFAGASIVTLILLALAAWLLWLAVSTLQSDR